MSDTLPENSFSGSLRVIKLTSGEEVIALIKDDAHDKIIIQFPALLQNYYTKDENGDTVEFVKLTNYLGNIEGYEILLPKTTIIYMGKPALDLQKMYEIYFQTMQTNPKSIVTSGPDDGVSSEDGLKLLNELFNNDDFVNFINDLMDTYEGFEIFEEELDETELSVESPETSAVEEEAKPQPKPRKRRKVKPETNKLPYNPSNPPEDPESWSDNPSDYI